MGAFDTGTVVRSSSLLMSVNILSFNTSYWQRIFLLLLKYVHVHLYFQDLGNFQQVTIVSNMQDTLKQIWVEQFYFDIVSQGSKLALVRWPVASGFAVGPEKSAIHWLSWLVKFWNPTSEFTWLSANFSHRMNQCKYLNWIHGYLGAWQTQQNWILKETLFSHFISGPVKVWSGQ